MKLMVLELDNRDVMVLRFLLFCGREIILETVFWIAVTRNQVPDRAFPWKFLSGLHLLPGQRYIE